MNRLSVARTWPLAVSLTAAALCAGCGGGATTLEVGSLLGGDTTVFDATRDAFSRPARNLTDVQRERFFVGNGLFNRNWVSAPSSTTTVDGLGPRFNARSCSACHPRDGRGAPPAADEAPLALLFRLSIPGADPHGGPRGDPTYGDQFAQNAILGVPADGRMVVEYAEVPGAYPDGSAYSLRRPTYAIADLAYGPANATLMLSPRIAPALVGLGLLESVPEATLAALAESQRMSGDGVAGRLNRVFDVRANRVVLGRFGWKANQPSVEQQVAGAFHGDIGITSSLFPAQRCTPAQQACLAAVSGGEPELADTQLADVTFYSRTLAVPARRNIEDPTVRSGERLFGELGCARCHTPTLTTGPRPDLPQLANQRMHPYTDLLLHDMGDGLADNRPDYEASGRHWRTPPLWGIGLVSVVNRHTFFLHDGRARSLEEAVLWHGGEALASRDRFKSLTSEERQSLLRFMESL